MLMRRYQTTERSTGSPDAVRVFRSENQKIHNFTFRLTDEFPRHRPVRISSSSMPGDERGEVVGTPLPRGQAVVVQKDQFTCGDCQRQFQDLGSFLQHKSTHKSLQGTLACYMCWFGFQTLGALQEHYSGYHHIKTDDDGGTGKDDGTTALRRSHEDDHNYQRVEGIKQLKLSGVKGRAAPATESGPREVVIVCTTDPKSQFVGRENNKLATLKMATKVMKNGDIDSPEMAAAEKKIDPTNAVGLYPPKVTERPKNYPINLKTYDKDFVFQMGMKESTGKSIRYSMEVFLCAHCPAFDRSHLDSLVQHMQDLHSSEIVDLCHPQVIRDTPKRDIPGIDKVTVTSFKEYRTALARGRSQQVEVHRRTRDAEHSCAYCKKRFTAAKGLRRHLKNLHPNSTAKQCMCEECGETFADSKSLRSHKRTGHSKAPHGRPEECSRCDFRSDRAEAWTLHYRIHPRTVSRLCDICGKSYANLSQHKRVHSLDRTHPCPVKGCYSRFNSEDSCLSHRYRAHAQKAWPFMCYLCNRPFSKRVSLQRHWTHLHGDLTDAKGRFMQGLPQNKPKT